MTRRFAALPLVAALAAASTAHAEGNPYSLSISQAVNHYSNIFNTAAKVVVPDPNDPSQSTIVGPVSDTLYSTTLLAGVDQPFGRQRFFANGAVSLNRYAKRDALNNTGYAFATGLDWSTVERLSGSLLYTASRSLSEFNPGGLVVRQDGTVGLPDPKRNLQTSQDATAKFRLGVVTRLSLEASLTYQQTAYSAPEFAPREFKQEREEFGVSYAFSGLLTARSGISLTQARYPKFEVDQDLNYISDRSKRRDLYVAATWTPTGVSTVTARLNFGKTSYERDLERNFSGVTGSVNWDWRPLGKLSFASVLARETGQDVNATAQTNGSTPLGPTFITDTNRVTDSVRINATYAATGKISATAGIAYLKRDFVDTVISDPNSVPQPNSDSTRILSFGGRWLPTRSVAVDCSFERTSRSSSTFSAFAYNANVYGCQASLTLN